MGKGKKKSNKGKKRRGDKKEKVRDNTNVDDSSSVQITPELLGPSPEQMERAVLAAERAILAATNRTEDPLKNWTRLQNEDCPICMRPLPIITTNNDPSLVVSYCVTCGKNVCMECVISVGVVQCKSNGGDVDKAAEKAMICPFCRTSASIYKTHEAELVQLMKRANAGDSEAMYHLGESYFHGDRGLPQDKDEGLKWYHCAIEAGCGRAACNIGNLLVAGNGVEQDTEKALEYYQKAVELGWIPAFCNIGLLLMRQGEVEESYINLRKAIMCGLSKDFLFEILRDGFLRGYITKEEYAFTLRENQSARNEMESEQGAV